MEKKLEALEGKVDRIETTMDGISTQMTNLSTGLSGIMTIEPHMTEMAEDYIFSKKEKAKKKEKMSEVYNSVKMYGAIFGLVSALGGFVGLVIKLF